MRTFGDSRLVGAENNRSGDEGQLTARLQSVSSSVFLQGFFSTEMPGWIKLGQQVDPVPR